MLDLNITEPDKTVMYWLPKMRETPIDVKFIVVSKDYSNIQNFQNHF